MEEMKIKEMKIEEMKIEEINSIKNTLTPGHISFERLSKTNIWNLEPPRFDEIKQILKVVGAEDCLKTSEELSEPEKNTQDDHVVGSIKYDTNK
jgi:hypothetical protein